MNRDLLYSKKFIVFQKKLLNRLLKQVAAYNKGKEINNSILEAEKKAAQEATEQGKTALEIESAKKQLVKQLRKANKVK